MTTLTLVESSALVPVRQRIEYRVASLVWRCQLGIAPIYLIDLCRVLHVVAPYALREGGSLSPVCSYHSHASLRFLC